MSVQVVVVSSAYIFFFFFFFFCSCSPVHGRTVVQQRAGEYSPVPVAPATLATNSSNSSVKYENFAVVVVLITAINCIHRDQLYFCLPKGRQCEQAVDEVEEVVVVVVGVIAASQSVSSRVYYRIELLHNIMTKNPIG
jgi:hypothetical protein